VELIGDRRMTLSINGKTYEAGELIAYVKKIEKENTELKKLKRECETSLCRAEYQYNYEQLTKAKDHIKKLLDCLKQDTNDPQTNYYVCQYMDKAEQFLKDSEVEK
jgi:5-bromo-4-chloroindolyl phosphate hydrolysis protein